MFPITNAERAAWQRRAAAALVEILDANRDLPVIVWTVAGAGSTLVGQISTLAPAVEVKTVLEGWNSALAVGERIGTPGGTGRLFLRASAVRGAVRVAVTATVVDDDGVGRR